MAQGLSVTFSDPRSALPPPSPARGQPAQALGGRGGGGGMPRHHLGTPDHLCTTLQGGSDWLRDFQSHFLTPGPPSPLPALLAASPRRPLGGKGGGGGPDTTWGPLSIHIQLCKVVQIGSGTFSHIFSPQVRPPPSQPCSRPARASPLGGEGGGVPRHHLGTPDHLCTTLRGGSDWLWDFQSHF